MGTQVDEPPEERLSFQGGNCLLIRSENRIFPTDTVIDMFTL